ncbi:YnbE-like lipoprotein [Azospirillum brasilense]|uniref:YnbE-like lipoprotein n=1 Tax=Azospirillum brasilense TaxID=192 RepID=A0A560BP13_AZOBR|nr:YnbE family lipoprotein [Azospirillum brasilense]MBK3732405.1 YnbE family lipoprotein [Azospirillum brasilense]TWA74331.1 YnbE-like lipoprotein [Azospirillum brasilense]TWA87301.1 YnbE-like lipoprotein [Azospirillum brasilense]
MRHTVRSRRVPTAALFAGLVAGLGACTPTVKVEAPDRPIEINLNIRIEQEVRVKVERDLEKAIADDPALFGLPPSQDSLGGAKGGKKP